MEQLCIVCNNKFNTNYTFQKICSADCQELRRQNYYKDNINKAKQYRTNNKKKYHKWYLDNKQSCSEYKKKKYLENRKEIREKQKQYYQKNKEKLKQGSKNWRLNNLEYIRNTNRIKLKEKYYNDEAYKLIVNLRARVGIAIKKSKSQKYFKTLDLIGCSITELRVYLEKQFKPGMSWKNHGFGRDKWNIDHIIPVASFDLTKEDEQKKCFNYKNLQPLWHEENARKSNKIIKGVLA